MNRRYLRSLIANLIANTIGIPDKAELYHELGLTPQQADDVTAIYNDVIEKRDLFFKDNGPDYELEIVRQFFKRKFAAAGVKMTQDELWSMAVDFYKELIA